MRRAGVVAILLCVVLSGCIGTYSMRDAKNMAKKKLGYEYTELSSDDYYYGQKIGNQCGILIDGFRQGAPFSELYLLPCSSAEEAERLYQRIMGNMNRTWDETERSFQGMYYQTDASDYVYVFIKNNMVAEVKRISSDGGGPWNEEEYNYYSALDILQKEEFEAFINNEFAALW